MKQKLLIIGLVAYSLIISLLYLKEVRKTPLATDSLDYEKNFRYNVDPNSYTTYQYSKSTGALISTAQDKNLDFNSEKSEYYVQGKGPIFVWRDYNEDGFPESCYFYSIDHKYAGKSLDNDSDGLEEYQEFVLQSGDTLSMTDQNKDGIWELQSSPKNN